MAFFGLISDGPPGLMVRGANMLLRSPRLSDFPAWSRLRAQSRDFLTPWEPIWPTDDLTYAGYRRRLRRYAEDMQSDHTYPFLVFSGTQETLVGGVTLANVRRGIVQAANLGYWIGAPYAHKGLMTAALRALLPAAFQELRLHRIEAACLPTNTPSIRLLERCGFTQEGLGRRYLCINGVWQDHLLYALLRDDPSPFVAPPLVAP
ncbi:MAG: N-acetyltransferase [Xanthobacteraceae bacterium]|nr:MAG: N-acetyltransferase [Xanthobacteraceae bacterium]